MLRVYCDTGGYHKALAELVRQGRIEVYQFKYEEKNRRIQKVAKPSSPQYRDLEHYTYNDLNSLTYSDLGQSSCKLLDIQRIIGKQHRVDAMHLDSAYMTGCKVFLTSDKDDVWMHREVLGALLGLKIFHIPSEIEEALHFINLQG